MTSDLPGTRTEPPARPRVRRRGLALLVLIALVVLLVTTGVGLAVGVLRSNSAYRDTLPAIGGSGGPGNGFASPVADAPAIAARVNPAVVDITTDLGYQGAQGAGTGIVLTPSGLVLTNNHVIAGATRIGATDVGNGRSYPASVVGYDRTHDVALVRLQGAAGLRTVSVGNSSAVRIGDSVVAIGNAGGLGGTPSAVPGTVTAVNQTITATDQAGGTSAQLSGLIQIAADVRPGDSGGPLVDAAGQVIGIDTAASTGSSPQGTGAGQGYAVPINQALTTAGQIVSGHGSATVHIGPTAMLGVQVIPVAGRGADAVAGVAVAGVVPLSPADRAGLIPGEVIEALDGQPVASPDTLAALIGRHHPGDTVRVSWTGPAGQTDTTLLRLATGPPA